MSNTNSTLTDVLSSLAQQRIKLKVAEDAAVKARRELDAQIVNVYVNHGLKKAEGAHSEKIEGVAKVTVDQEIKRTVSDDELLKQAWANMSAAQMACFRWKPEVNVTNFKALQELDPAAFQMIANFVVSKPATPSVKVEILEAKQ